MDLIQAMRVEYARSKSWFLGATVLNASLYIAAVLNALVSGWIAQALGVLAVIAQIGLFWIRRIYSRHYSGAERIRRMAMLKDGLAVQPNDLEIAQLLAQTSGVADIETPFVDPYYESKLKAGPRRLIDILRESAFFTSGLAKTCSCVFFGITAVGFAMTVFALVWMAMSDAPRSTLEIIARSAVVFMAFWASGDMVDMAFRFHDLSTATDGVLSRCQEALTSNKADETGLALVLLGEYNCAVLEAPPIPNMIYRLRQQQLNYAWRSRGSNK